MKKLDIKKYYKYIVLIIIILIVFIIILLVNKDTKEETVKIEENILEEKVTTTIETKTVFVDIKGAINKPGVYELEDNKRIIDVINNAGGLKKDADTSNLNLSKIVKDEMYIIIYTKNELYEYKASKEITCPSFECICPDNNNDACIKEESESNKENNSLISITKASKEELMTLPSIGESKAQNIIDYRNKNGFKTIEDIKNVEGIGDSLYEKIKDKITL